MWQFPRGRSLKKARPEPEELKEALETSEYLTYLSVSMGQDLRLSGPGITGAGLIVEEELNHLSIFPATDKANKAETISGPRGKEGAGWEVMKSFFNSRVLKAGNIIKL